MPSRRFWLHSVAIALGIYLGLWLCSGDRDPDARERMALPRKALTPGFTRNLSLKEVCTTKWGRDVRHVTLGMRKQVFASYGIPYERHREFELDHLIPRSLAGADDVKNLWPQPLKQARKFKDPLEVKLGTLVCSGQLPLKDAQQKIASDWWGTYSKLYPH